MSDRLIGDAIVLVVLIVGAIMLGGFKWWVIPAVVAGVVTANVLMWGAEAAVRTVRGRL